MMGSVGAITTNVVHWDASRTQRCTFIKADASAAASAAVVLTEALGGDGASAARAASDMGVPSDRLRKVGVGGKGAGRGCKKRRRGPSHEREPTDDVEARANEKQQQQVNSTNVTTHRVSKKPLHRQYRRHRRRYPRPYIQSRPPRKDKQKRPPIYAATTATNVRCSHRDGGTLEYGGCLRAKKTSTATQTRRVHSHNNSTGRASASTKLLPTKTGAQSLHSDHNPRGGPCATGARKGVAAPPLAHSPTPPRQSAIRANSKDRAHTQSLARAITRHATRAPSSLLHTSHPLRTNAPRFLVSETTLPPPSPPPKSEKTALPPPASPPAEGAPASQRAREPPPPTPADAKKVPSDGESGNLSPPPLRPTPSGASGYRDRAVGGGVVGEPSGLSPVGGGMANTYGLLLPRSPPAPSSPPPPTPLLVASGGGAGSGSPPTPPPTTPKSAGGGS